MNKRHILFLVFILLTSVLAGQNASISGRVFDQDEGIYLPGANIILKDSSLIMKYAAITDTDGFFTIESVNPGEYTLIVSYIGYSNYEGPLIVEPSKNILLGKINLGQTSATLEEVQVTAKVPPVQSKGDTTEFNAGAFKTAPNALADQLVRKMPGMEMGRDGSVTAQGEQVQRVLVDGKPFFGDDPSIAMKNIPAEMIDKIQVFDQLSEQSQFSGFDDGNRVRTMNIITRVEKKEGSFGRVYAGGGTDQRYELGGTNHLFSGKKRMAILGMSNNINEQNFATQDILNALGSSGRSRWGGRGGGGGVGVNSFQTGNSDGINTTHSLGAYYTNEWRKLEATASYFGNFSRNKNEQSIFRDFLIGVNAGQTFDQDAIQRRDNLNHRMEVRLDYKPSDKISFLYTPSIRWQDTESSNNSNAFTYSREDVPINTSVLDNEYERQGLQWNNRLLIRKSFDKKGRTLSANIRADVAPGDGRTEAYSLNTFQSESGSTDTTLLDQIAPNTDDRFNFSTNFNYTEPLGEKSQLQFQYEFGYNQNREEQLSFLADPVDPDQYTLAEFLSNDIQSRYIRHIPGITYRSSWENWNFNMELETQWAGLNNELELPELENIDLEFFNLLPSFSIQYRKSRSNQFRFYYRTSTNEPSVNQLRSSVDISDPLNISTGNPELKQEYQHRFIIRYSNINAEKGFNLFAFGFLQMVDDRIANQRIISDGNLILPGGYTVGRGGQFTQPVNLSGYYSLRSYLSAGKPFFKQKINMNANMSYRLTRDPALLDQTLTNTLTSTIQPGISISSNISDKTDFSVSGSAGHNIVSRDGIDEEDTKYTSWTFSADLTQFITDRWYFQTDIAYFKNQGLSDDFDAPWLLWRASTGVMLFPKKQAELRLFWFDISRQNDQIQRIISDIFIEDQQNTVLQPYLMLRFTWFMNAFNAQEQNVPESMRGGRSGFGPGRN